VKSCFLYSSLSPVN